jgi:hypothetical protein
VEIKNYVSQFGIQYIHLRLFDVVRGLFALKF